MGACFAKYKRRRVSSSKPRGDEQRSPLAYRERHHQAVLITNDEGQIEVHLACADQLRYATMPQM
eukprot:561170-Prorocentrum_minimum.AAC.2